MSLPTSNQGSGVARIPHCLSAASLFSVSNTPATPLNDAQLGGYFCVLIPRSTDDSSRFKTLSAGVGYHGAEDLTVPQYPASAKTNDPVDQ